MYVHWDAGKGALAHVSCERAPGYATYGHDHTLARPSWVYVPDKQAGRVPHLGPPGTVLRRSVGVAAAVAGAACAPRVATAVYDHWLSRRASIHKGGPLLPHLWFHQPWKVRNSASAFHPHFRTFPRDPWPSSCHCLWGPGLLVR